MRTFEERKAEVMRRSKKRIAHRRRMISGALSCFVLLVVAAVGAKVWDMTPDLLSDHNTSGTDIGENIDLGSLHFGGKTEYDEDSAQILAVTVTDGVTATRYTDEDDVSAILSALEAAKASTDPVMEEATDGNANGSPLPEVQTEGAITVTGLQYTITVGTQWYMLVPNKLMDVAAQLHYELSDEMYCSLLAAIGVS